MKTILLFCSSIFLTSALFAQDVGTGPAEGNRNMSLGDDEIRSLREELAAQKRQLQQQQQEIEELRQEMASRKVAALDSEQSKSAANLDSGHGIGQTKLQQDDRSVSKESPLSFRIGDAEFTPGGFMDFTTIFRSTNVGSGIGTSFGSIPFNDTVAGRLTETRLRAQNSRISLRVSGKLGANDITGYVESDFLGFQPSNGLVTSNSNSFRLRLYWADIRRGKWEILGGQSWSFLNPNRNGFSPMPSDIFYTQNMDTNYQVGLTWTRAAQFRLIYHPSDNWAMGVALENPEQYIGGAVVLPSALATPLATQLDNGTLTSTPNLHPDILPKVAYDGKWGGRHMHVEAVGLVRSFKVFNPTFNSSSTTTGAGGSINLNLEAFRNFHLIANSFYSYGGGRYIFGLGPDLIVKPDGTPSLIHSGSGIGGFESQATSRTMFYGYYGGAYFQRNIAVDPATGKFIGFGFPGSSSSSNKDIQEGTLGVIQSFWKDPRYGALQLITQYSYLTRSPWSIGIAAPKNAHTNLGYVDLRYVLP